MKQFRLFNIFASIAITAVCASQPLFADSYKMSVVLDRAHGDLVQQGDYEAAITRIPHDDHRLPFASSNNLCVAQTMSGQFDREPETR